MASIASPAQNGKAYKFVDHSYDVIVVGAGGAGMTAALFAVPPIGRVADHVLAAACGVHGPAVLSQMPDAGCIERMEGPCVGQIRICDIFDH